MLTVIQISVRYVNHQSGCFPIRVFPKNKNDRKMLKSEIASGYKIEAGIMVPGSCQE